MLRDRAVVVRALAGLMVSLILIVVAVRWVGDSEGQGAVTLVLALTVGAVVLTWRKVHAAYLVRISREGIAVEAGAIPWGDIAEVHVVSQRLSVILTAGSALPSGMQGRIMDPNAADSRTRLEVDYPSEHAERIARAARECAPSGVRVTTA